MGVVIPFILDARLVNTPAGVSQEEGHTGFPHLPSALIAIIFLARRIQPFLSLVDREVDCCEPRKISSSGVLLWEVIISTRYHFCPQASVWRMGRLTRDGTAEPVSRYQILRHVQGQGNIHFLCSADHEQDWQPYPVDPYSAICDDLWSS